MANVAQELIRKSLETATTVRADYSAELAADLQREVNREHGAVHRYSDGELEFRGATGWSIGTAKFGWKVCLAAKVAS